MAKNTPDAIPEAFQTEALVDAYRDGWNHGHGIACHNVPDLGAELFTDGMGRITVNAENIREVHANVCHEAADNSRCYSPFEFTAHEFNSARPEDLEIEEDNGEDGDTIFIVSDADEVTHEFETREAAQAWIDAQPDSEQLWEAFEAGTGDAIAADLAEYTDEDYGIEAVDDETEDEEGE